MSMKILTPTLRWQTHTAAMLAWVEDRVEGAALRHEEKEYLKSGTLTPTPTLTVFSNPRPDPDPNPNHNTVL